MAAHGLRLLRGGGDSVDRERLAWAAVRDGFRVALSFLSPGDSQYERLRRCLIKASILAGQPLDETERA